MDGPSAEAREVMLGFSMLDCANTEEAVQTAKDLQKSNPYAVCELRPIPLYLPGVAFPVTEAAM